MCVYDLLPLNFQIGSIMKNLIVLILLTFSSTCCHKKKTSTPIQSELDDNYQCKIDNIISFKTQNEITNLFDNSIIQSLANSNAPDLNGAMSNNKTGYFSVRFQMAISNLADYAIDSESPAALEAITKAIEYSFQYQLANGDFQIVVPANSPNPTSVDIASTNAFFLSSLGASLLALQESPFYNDPSNITYKNRIEVLRPKILTSLNWLISNQTLLANYDANAPNRLFFDAIAYYSVGKWLNNTTGKSIGLNFAQSAILKKSSKGYFMEGDGWDSSYQGVSLINGFKLLSIFDTNELLRQPLWDCISCGTNWQVSRILSTGEISTSGNTRVYPGGEQFLGSEKKVAWKSTVITLLTMRYLSGKIEYETVANKVRAFYE
jgi:hypothetical protein